VKQRHEDGLNDSAVEDDESTGCLTREEIMLSAMGIDTGGSKTFRGKTKKLEACAYCRQVRDTTEQMRPLQCSGCMRAFSCCSEHQKLDWPFHKKTCQLSAEEQEQEAYGPFGKEFQQAVKDGIFLPKERNNTRSRALHATGPQADNERRDKLAVVAVLPFSKKLVYSRQETTQALDRRDQHWRNANRHNSIVAYTGRATV
jgi:MYND finger